MNNQISFIKNSVDSDIYIGIGAGRKLLLDLEDAKKSVRIISPFLSPIYIEKLIDLKKKGLDVRLITSDEIEDYNNIDKEPIISQLIKQDRQTDEKLKKYRDKLIRVNKWILSVCILIILLSILVSMYFENMAFIPGIIIAAILFIIFISLVKQIRNIKIYSYSYSELFPFKVFISPYNNKFNRVSDFFIHSKVYIIDDEIAYLGSINFSRSGLEYNFETRIRITDKESIIGLKDMFEELFNNNDNYSISTETWGKQIYFEPQN